MPTRFAVALRAARTAAGLTQRQLAERAWPASADRGAFSNGAPLITNVERGKPCGLALAVRLARALDIEPHGLAQAALEDRLGDVLPASELTSVVVGLRAYAQRCSEEEWAAIRGVTSAGER